MRQSNSSNLDKDLVKAASRGDVKQVDALLRSADKLDLPDEATTLMLSARYGNVAVVDLLLKCGENVNFVANGGVTALMVAAEADNIGVVRLLLKHRANINADFDGCTALFLAAYHGFSDIVKLLLSHGADVNLAIPGGVTALMVAAEADNIGAVRLLLRHRAAADLAMSDGRTALVLAAARGNADVVDLLLSGGADINATDCYEQTALMLAAQAGRSDVVDLLLKKGAKVNLPTSDGVTALMIAAQAGRSDVVELLLRHGAEAQPELQGDTIVEAALTLIAEERATHRLMCHGIKHALTAEEGAYDAPVDSKEFDTSLISLLPAEAAVKIATMSAAKDMPFALASSIAQNVICPQEDEKEEKIADSDLASPAPSAS